MSHRDALISSWHLVRHPYLSLCVLNNEEVFLSQSIWNVMKRKQILLFSVSHILHRFDCQLKVSGRSCPVPVDADSWLDPWAACQLGMGTVIITWVVGRTQGLFISALPQRVPVWPSEAVSRFSGPLFPTWPLLRAFLQHVMPRPHLIYTFPLYAKFSQTQEFSTAGSLTAASPGQS